MTTNATSVYGTYFFFRIVTFLFAVATQLLGTTYSSSRCCYIQRGKYIGELYYVQIPRVFGNKKGVTEWKPLMILKT